MPAYELKKAVDKVGATPLNFALYKGEDEDQIVISAGAPSAVVLQEVTKECGKLKLLLKGTCFYDGDTLVFAIATPAPQWKMQIAAILKHRQCQGISKIDVRPAEAAASGGAPASGGDGLSAKWRTAREAAVQSASELVGKLRATGDPDAAQASGLVEKLAAGFPTALETAIANFEKASASQDAKLTAAARAQAQTEATACLAYLETHRELIDLCEHNPFGVKVAVSQPLIAALQSIQEHLG
jgi:hypothetical protein